MRSAALALAWSLFAVASAAVPAPAKPLPVAGLATGPGERVLIVAPHPDDETLCCAGFMQRAIATGARVSIVWVTSGDAFELDAALLEHTLLPGHKALRKLAADRMREATAAAGQLGVAATDLWFLGYPDRGIRRLLTDYYARPYTSHYTGAVAVPYDNAFAPGSAYEGRLLERDLVAVLDRVRPTLVLAPSPLDHHPDHAAVGDLVLRLMSARGAMDSVRYWVVHGGSHWPAPRRYAPMASLKPPPALQSLDWSTWPLTPTERDAKLTALRAYRSQWKIMEPFVASFVRANELFAALSYPAEPAQPRLETESGVASVAPN